MLFEQINYELILFKCMYDNNLCNNNSFSKDLIIDTYAHVKKLVKAANSYCHITKVHYILKEYTNNELIEKIDKNLFWIKLKNGEMVINYDYTYTCQNNFPHIAPTSIYEIKGYFQKTRKHVFRLLFAKTKDQDYQK